MSSEFADAITENKIASNDRENKRVSFEETPEVETPNNTTNSIAPEPLPVTTTNSFYKNIYMSLYSSLFWHPFGAVSANTSRYEYYAPYFVAIATTAGVAAMTYAYSKGKLPVINLGVSLRMK